MAGVTEAPPGNGSGVPDGAAQDFATGSTRHPEIDWVAVGRTPEFRELVRRRWSFTIPVLTFVFIWYFGFIALAGYAPGFMGKSIYEGFTVGYAFALSQFVMTWFLGWLYLRQADRVFDPLSKRAAEGVMPTSPPPDGGPAGPVTDGEEVRH